MTSVPNERPKSRRNPRPLHVTVDYDEPSPEVLARQVRAVLYLLGRTDLDGAASQAATTEPRAETERGAAPAPPTPRKQRQRRPSPELLAKWEAHRQAEADERGGER